MKHVKPHISGPRDTQNGVGICAVVVQQPAFAVDYLFDPLDVFIEQPQGVGVGEHQPRHGFVHCRLKRFHVYAAPVIRRHFSHGKAAQGSRCGVGAVGRVGNEDLGPLQIVPGPVVGSDYQNTCKLTVSSCSRLQGYIIHTCDFCQVILEFIHELQGALSQFFRHIGMDAAEPGKIGCIFADLGVVLHCT